MNTIKNNFVADCYNSIENYINSYGIETNTFFVNNFKATLPEIFLTTGILIILVYGVVAANIKINKTYPVIIQPITWLCIFLLLATAMLIANDLSYDKSTILAFSGSIASTNLNEFIRIIILLFSAIVLIISTKYMKINNINSYEFPILVTLATTGSILLVNCNDLLLLYLAIELQSLASYVLAAFKRDANASTEAGLKYFLLGALSSGIILMGCAIIYNTTGTTNFGQLYMLTVNSSNFFNIENLTVGIIFLLIGFLFKMTAAPFHMWTPDVYEGSPTSVTAFFSIVPKIAALTVVIKILFFTFYDLIDIWQNILIPAAIGSLIVGSLGALYQTKLKRLLAYSSIGHIGFLLLGLITGTEDGLYSIYIYILIYMIMSVILFAVILNLSTIDNKSPEVITDLTLLKKKNPLVAATLMLTLFSMAGVPPMAGFFSKFYILSSCISSSMYVLATIAVLSSVVSAVYYIRIIKCMYFDSVESWNINLHYESSYLSCLIISISLCFITIFFIKPSYFMTLFNLFI
jgi:NADH-quinone oxidoreductase subunit N